MIHQGRIRGGGASPQPPCTMKPLWKFVPCMKSRTKEEEEEKINPVIPNRGSATVIHHAVELRTGKLICLKKSIKIWIWLGSTTFMCVMGLPLMMSLSASVGNIWPCMVWKQEEWVGRTGARSSNSMFVCADLCARINLQICVWALHCVVSSMLLNSSSVVSCATLYKWVNNVCTLSLDQLPFIIALH